MKRPCIFFLACLLFALIVHAPLRAETEPPREGGKLPAFKLSIPKSVEEKNYLGLSGSGSFSIPQIKTKMVIIEIFNMYCPHCQAAAPEVNKLYSAIENNPVLRGKIKLIGIGAGNSQFEVDLFRKKYAVLFPLFPDADFSIHEVCGRVATPYFIGIKIYDDGSHKVIYSQLGGFDDASQFLTLFLKETR
jgi:thiol-disulfide isomerase/thioredoxin